jgi:hypothetical protein
VARSTSATHCPVPPWAVHNVLDHSVLLVEDRYGSTVPLELSSRLGEEAGQVTHSRRRVRARRSRLRPSPRAEEAQQPQGHQRVITVAGCGSLVFHGPRSRSSGVTSVGKRNQTKARDRRSAKHIKVFDAAQVISMADQCTAPLTAPRARPEDQHAARIAWNILNTWHQSQVVLRADNEFVDALLNSDTDVRLSPDWLARLPFTSLAASLPSPLSLHDGRDLCHYVGFIAAGVRHDPLKPGQRTIYTRYGPLTEGDGIRFLWVYNADGDPTSRCQTVTVTLRGELAVGETLTELIEAQRANAELMGQHWGAELPTLVPLSLQLLLYLTAQEPDLDWIPPERMSRPNQLRTARVANLGWRVGAALRAWPQRGTAGRSDSENTATDRALPPHIRRAHWHRVRVATGTRRAESSAEPTVHRAPTGTTSCAGTRPHR